MVSALAVSFCSVVSFLLHGSSNHFLSNWISWIVTFFSVNSRSLFIALRESPPAWMFLTKSRTFSLLFVFGFPARRNRRCIGRNCNWGRSVSTLSSSLFSRSVTLRRTEALPYGLKCHHQVRPLHEELLRCDHHFSSLLVMKIGGSPKSIRRCSGRCSRW